MQWTSSRELGQQFDAELGAIFVELANRRALLHIVEYSDQGIPLAQCGGCGSIILRSRRASTGDTLYCPSCHVEYTIASAGGLMSDGRKNTARALAAVPDSDLINRLVKESIAARS